ncbi:hypothetical protein FN846DRAFT_916829 [Sphaerosporella brunnea]|uniref:Chitin-binding type-2 domain-containing protein n=1 Tax=Sphaerosporella brunnea TaxID=1250544 RepID=A0A5J5F602_9PEZI|nr:hypothetical protein FN846DRAFT_916829 [Sphaerosporella brunnea]
MQFTLIATVLALAASVAAAPSGTCPEIHPTDPTTFLTDDADCNVFYICDYSGPVKFNCPAGLDFSPNSWNCDYPAHAGCTVGGPHY